jgi:Tol biopolymer transport system component
MQKRAWPGSLFIFVAFLSSCTVSTSQQPIGAPSPRAVGAPATSAPATQPSITPGFPTPYTIPVRWSGLNLSGKLIFVVNTASINDNYMDIQELDLHTGGIRTIFQSVANGWIDSAVISPDHKQIVMSYSTPALQQGAHFTPLALFSMPMDGSRPPQQLFPLPLKDDQHFEPVWSPDGTYLYFVLVNNGVPPAEPNQHYAIDQIYRAAFPGGQPEKILEKAYWPRLSADGSRLIYVTENPDDGTNKLFVANNDGSNPQQIVLSGANAPNIIDAPIFLPDGKSILFSAPPPVQSRTIPWLDRLFGVIEASAHNIPSEWWSVPAQGGTPTQLTHIQAASLYAAISPDNRNIASFSGDGVFVMNPDGTNLTMILGNAGGNAGTVNWIP